MHPAYLETHFISRDGLDGWPCELESFGGELWIGARADAVPRAGARRSARIAAEERDDEHEVRHEYGLRCHQWW